MDPFFHTGLSISDSLKTVRKSVLIYETIIIRIRFRRLKKVSVRATTNDDEPCKNNLTVDRTL